MGERGRNAAADPGWAARLGPPARRRRVTVDSKTPMGARLRRARLDRSLSLADVGDALHVPARYIHAIETDDYAALPPTVYTRALIREYARYMGMNPAELL